MPCHEPHLRPASRRERQRTARCVRASGRCTGCTLTWSRAARHADKVAVRESDPLNLSFCVHLAGALLSLLALSLSRARGVGAGGGVGDRGGGGGGLCLVQNSLGGSENVTEHDQPRPLRTTHHQRCCQIVTLIISNN